jgi:hypothetical protein
MGLRWICWFDSIELGSLLYDPVWQATCYDGFGIARPWMRVIHVARSN